MGPEVFEGVAHWCAGQAQARERAPRRGSEDIEGELGAFCLLALEVVALVADEEAPFDPPLDGLALPVGQSVEQVVVDDDGPPAGFVECASDLGEDVGALFWCAVDEVDADVEECLLDLSNPVPLYGLGADDECAGDAGLLPSPDRAGGLAESHVVGEDCAVGHGSQCADGHDLVWHWLPAVPFVAPLEWSVVAGRRVEFDLGCLGAVLEHVEQ